MDNKTSAALLQDSHVKAALLADKGGNAILESWDTKPFTKKGDNFSAFITSIIIKYSLDGKEDEVSYVAKLNPCRYETGMIDMHNLLFRKEGEFYMDILKDINSELIKVGEKQLEFPKCFFTSYEMKREVIIFEDLRTLDYKLTNRLKGMDVQHATLVMQAMGRFHGGSILLQQKMSLKDLSKKYETLNDDPWVEKLIDLWLINGVKICSAFLDSIGGYEPVRQWIDNVLKNVNEFLADNWGDTPPFNVVGHGDCWTNNVLFRYNDEGLPVETMLLDLEASRFCSLAVDLTHFMATSLDGKTRKEHKDHFLREYYRSLTSVIEGGAGTVPFSFEELQQEFNKKIPFGFCWGIAALPIILLPPEDLPDFDSYTEGNKEVVFEEMIRKTVKNIGSNAYLKSRLLALIDELMEDGVLGS